MTLAYIFSEIPIAVIVIPIFILFVFALYYFNKKQVILRKLSKTRHRAISSLKTNEFVKVHGKALHVKEPLIAPLSKRKCVFYTMKLERKVSSGKSSYWKTVVDEEKTQDFFLEQNGSYVIVRPKSFPNKNYKSFLVKDKKASSGVFNDPTPEFKALLKAYNIDSEGFFGFNKKLRYEEGVIEIGEKLTVAGIAKWKTLNEPIPEYAYSKIVELISDEKEKLIITDHPNTLKESRIKL
ncbi:GIDE domain-containing protein [Flavivirga amylovorans]|uniref:GIDE domain-containing protein n=1 Tax=Flavivirga amylovorans TaxID=870486 RepID=A0ABT8X2R6_9FLAO|nr:GIDE domain-containing protein [Flavivirga amylovorans]MDO5988214.1 GIDE domain-containing protein [Flavivirga amylovorans]